MLRYGSLMVWCNSFVDLVHSLAVSLAMFRQPEPQPDNEEHEQEVAAINEDIKKIKEQIEQIRTKIDESTEARRGQGVRMLTCGLKWPPSALVFVMWTSS